MSVTQRKRANKYRRPTKNASNFTILKNESQLNKNKRMMQLEEYRRVPEEMVDELVNILWFKALQRLD
jgi:hypothetical protein